jgi:hypothetical protein
MTRSASSGPSGSPARAQTGEKQNAYQTAPAAKDSEEIKIAGGVHRQRLFHWFTARRKVVVTQLVQIKESIHSCTSRRDKALREDRSDDMRPFRECIYQSIQIILWVFLGPLERCHPVKSRYDD